jgi:ribosomal protein L11 methyltransferase
MRDRRDRRRDADFGPSRGCFANLFSGILCEAAARIGACVADWGELWLSGILRTQADDVKAAYRREKLRLIGERRRGKWVMLQLSRT